MRGGTGCSLIHKLPTPDVASQPHDHGSIVIGNLVLLEGNLHSILRACACEIFTPVAGKENKVFVLVFGVVTPKTETVKKELLCPPQVKKDSPKRTLIMSVAKAIPSSSSGDLSC